MGTADTDASYSNSDEAEEQNRTLLLELYNNSFDYYQVVEQSLTSPAWEVFRVAVSNGIRSGSVKSRRVLGSDGATLANTRALVNGLFLALLEADHFIPPPEHWKTEVPWRRP